MRKSLIAICTGLLAVVAAPQAYAGTQYALKDCRTDCVSEFLMCKHKEDRKSCDVKHTACVAACNKRFK